MSCRDGSFPKIDYPSVLSYTRFIRAKRSVASPEAVCLVYGMQIDVAPKTTFVLKIVFLVFALAACQAPKTPESAPTLSPSPTSAPTPPAPTQTTPISPTVAADLAQPHPILGDLRLRQGIAHCTDRQALFSMLYPWIGDPEAFIRDSFLPPSHWAYNPNVTDGAGYPYDPDKGMQLLEEAGWQLSGESPYRVNQAGERLRLSLSTSQAETRKKYVPLFVEQMKACGVEVVSNYLPAQEFFGVDAAQPGELARRNFDLAVYSWVNQADTDWRALFGCDSIPNAENGWQGMNFSGWCNPQVEVSLQQLHSHLDRQTQLEAYRDLQRAFAQDTPIIPLFSRLELYAVDPNLENFAPNPSELYTWNAYRWSIPGKESITLGFSAEPASLFPLDTDYTSLLIQALVYGLNYTQLDYDFEAGLLEQIPSQENGLVMVKPVQVSEGDDVVDVNGELVTLEAGAQVRDARGEIVSFSGEPLTMNTLVVEFRFKENLRWSDGEPVTQEDYELYYRAICDPATGAEEYLTPPKVCQMMAKVNFSSDRAYVVTWKPGYREAEYQLPPISRLPAHQVLSTGERMGDSDHRQWMGLEEVRSTPLGAGPYRLIRWEYGKEIVLQANPYFALGAPTTETIVIRFVPIDAGMDPVTLIEQDQVDVIGYDSLFNLKPDEEALFKAQAEGKIRLYPITSSIYEQIGLAITLP